MLDIDYQANFIFAYEIPREALNSEVIPSLSPEEMKHINVPKKAENGQDDEGLEYEETKNVNNDIEETKEDQVMHERKYEVIPPEQLFKPEWI